MDRPPNRWCQERVRKHCYMAVHFHSLVCRSLAKNSARLPHAGSVIAASSASPIDALYIAAIFDPIFVSCYPHTRLIEPISLFQAMLRAFYYPKLQPAAGAKMVDLETHLRNNPRRVILMFPECTTSNGRGILPMSPALLAAPRKTKVFPVNLRYTAPDITTPIPHTYLAFLWNLCSKPSHCIRIRIAEAVYNVHRNTDPTSRASSVDVGNEASSDAETLVGSEDPEGPQTREERAFMDKIGEALARLGRVKRVGLGVKEKQDFVNTWTKTRGRWR